MKIKLSDFAGFSPDKAKTACNETVFKNGARCFAIIEEENHDDYK